MFFCIASSSVPPIFSNYTSSPSSYLTSRRPSSFTRFSSGSFSRFISVSSYQVPKLRFYFYHFHHTFHPCSPSQLALCYIISERYTHYPNQHSALFLLISSLLHPVSNMSLLYKSLQVLLQVQICLQLLYSANNQNNFISQAAV